MNITNETLDVFEDAEAKHTFTHAGGYRRCCYRAGLEAAAPLIAAQALRDYAEDLEAEDEWGLRYKTGRVGCELIERLPGDGGHVFGSRKEAQAHIAAWRAHFPNLVYTDVRYARRITWTGPWEDAAAEGAP